MSDKRVKTSREQMLDLHIKLTKAMASVAPQEAVYLYGADGAVINAFAAAILPVIEAERQDVLTAIEAVFPKRIPYKFFAKNKDDSPWSMGWNDAIGECKATLRNLKIGNVNNE